MLAQLTDLNVTLEIPGRESQRLWTEWLRFLLRIPGRTRCSDTYQIVLARAQAPCFRYDSPAKTNVTFVFSLGMYTLNLDPAETNSTYRDTST